MSRVLLVVALLAGSASARPPSHAEKEARKLDREAEKALKRGDLDQAIRTWTRAEAVHPSWRYPFGAARAHMKVENWIEAWGLLERAVRLAERPSDKAQAQKLLSEVVGTLERSYALLELEVVPPDAQVRLQGRDWPAPRRLWVKRAQSTLHIVHPSYVPLRATWRHPLGSRAKRVIRLEPTSTYGRIRVSGTPTGAVVRIDGQRAGALPVATSRFLKPGRYTVRIESNLGYHERVVSVKAGAVARVETDLVVLAKVGQEWWRSKAIWGWSTLGTGIALAAVGAGLAGHAASMVDNLTTLNALHVSGYDDYARQYRAQRSEIDDYSAAGYALLGVGLAVAAGGATLLVLDHLEKRRKTTGAARKLGWQVTPLGGGLLATMRF